MSETTQVQPDLTLSEGAIEKVLDIRAQSRNALERSAFIRRSVIGFSEASKDQEEGEKPKSSCFFDRLYDGLAETSEILKETIENLQKIQELF